jgi:protein-tyrosine phosphatase
MIRGAFGSGIASRIAPKLWQGGFPIDPAGLRGKFDAIVLCAVELQPDGIADADTFPEDVEVICAPLRDEDDIDVSPEEIEVATWAANRVIEALRAGKRVLSTCAMGRNRSGLVSALALVGRYGMSGREAAAHVRRRRKNALTNPSFSEFLDRVPPGGRLGG